MLLGEAAQTPAMAEQAVVCARLVIKNLRALPRSVDVVGDAADALAKAPRTASALDSMFMTLAKVQTGVK